MVRKYVGSILFLCLLIGITIYVLVAVSYTHLTLPTN